jgi:dihydrofolate reductase
MLLSLIVAVARNGVIGRDNHLPWRLPEDLKHFKARTLTKPVLMGRRTFESIGRPLPGRTNLVLTRDLTFQAAGVLGVHSLEQALKAVPNAPELIVIGGAIVYGEALPFAQRIYLTRVNADVTGDAYFPALDAGEWRLTQRAAHPADDRHAHAFTFETLERVQHD